MGGREGGREETYLPSETESFGRARARAPTPLAHEVDIGNLRFDHRICFGSDATPRHLDQPELERRLRHPRRPSGLSFTTPGFLFGDFSRVDCVSSFLCKWDAINLKT